MTIKQMYESCLIELNKQEAPSILLEDFNYLANKAINQYINRKYNIYDVNQQSTDDLRVLKATAILDPTKANYEDTLMQELTGATYEVNLPDDYLHILNCICVYQVKGGNYKCYNNNSYVRFGAKRLTADMWGQVINNFYMKPSYKRPYYYIHNVNTSVELPTNPIVYDDKENYISGTDYTATVTTTTTQPSSGGGDTPNVPTYKVEYGIIADPTILNGNPVPDGTLNINGPKTIICKNQTKPSDCIVYVRIQENSPYEVSKIYFEEETEDNQTTILSTNLPNDYKKSGYTTYIGVMQDVEGGLLQFGPNRQAYIKITSKS